MELVFLKKVKIYLDTSVISHLFAEDTPDKMTETNKLWNDLSNGVYDIFISILTLDEMRKCTEPKQTKMIEKLEEIEYEILVETDEITSLAHEYIKNGVLTPKSSDDCQHIAFAVASNCDLIVSWNFKHLVNFKTISKVKVVNAIHHYKEISIISPTMLIGDEDE